MRVISSEMTLVLHILSRAIIHAFQQYVMVIVIIACTLNLRSLKSPYVAISSDLFSELRIRYLLPGYYYSLILTIRRVGYFETLYN